MIEIYNYSTGGYEPIAKMDYKSWEFAGGERGVKLDIDDEYNIMGILARIQNSNDIIDLMMMNNVINNTQRHGCLDLVLPYLSYGRQDRICNKGEAFSLKVFCDLINGMKFDKVTILDCHSHVGTALLNNVHHISQLDIISMWPEFVSRLTWEYADNRNITFVSPDGGSLKKTADLAQHFQHHDFIRADKLRNLATGEIKETIVYSDDLQGKDCVIVDDIIDGARTFIELAKVLRSKNAGKIILYGTHSIFSKGVDVILEMIDEIWTTNSFKTEYDKRVKVFDIVGVL